jgi:hypothetical protein
VAAILELQSITFQNFIIQAGTDASLVPTDMATTNSTVKFTYKNSGTFFGIHVTADPFTLSYSQLNLAAGDVSLIAPSFSRSLLAPTGSGWRPKKDRIFIYLFLRIASLYILIH